MEPWKDKMGLWNDWNMYRRELSRVIKNSWNEDPTDNLERVSCYWIGHRLQQLSMRSPKVELWGLDDAWKCGVWNCLWALRSFCVLLIVGYSIELMNFTFVRRCHHHLKRGTFGFKNYGINCANQIAILNVNLAHIKNFSEPLYRTFCLFIYLNIILIN